MGLQHLPPQTRHNDSAIAAIFNNTWGHYAPQKNVSYRGVVRFTLTDHSAYGSQPIILQYDFPNLNGPYIHDKLFEYVHDWRISEYDIGAVYEVQLTFRNYRFYYSKVKQVLNPINPQ